MKKFSHYFILLTAILFFIPSCTPDKDTNAGKEDQGPFELSSRLRSEPDRLNPIMTGDAGALHVNYKIFPSLLDKDPFSLELTPMLAKARPTLEVLKKGEYDGDATHKFTFEILDEAVWDNGKPVLASDYLFTLKAIFNPEVTGAEMFRGIMPFIKDMIIDADNPKKFSVYVKGVFRSESGAGFYILPEHVYDPKSIMRNFKLRNLIDKKAYEKIKDDPRLKEFGTHFMDPKYSREVIESCGAYKFVSWTTDQEIVLEKKKNWWGDKLASKNPALTAVPDKITFKIIKDETAALTAMKDGALDIAGALTVSGYEDVKNGNLADQFNFYTPVRALYSYLGLNTKRPHLSDKRVRRAIAHVTDVDEIIKVLQKGDAEQLVSFLEPDAPYNNNNLKPIPFDIEKAKSLLAEAGWKDSNGDGIVDKKINGQSTELIVKILATPASTNAPPLASLLAESAKKAGIRFELEIVDASRIREVLAKRDFDAWFAAVGWDLEEYDPYQLFHTDSDTPEGRNRAGFGNAASNAVIEEIRSTDNPTRRVELYHQLQEMVYDEQPIVFLYVPKDRIITSKRLDNVKTSMRYPAYFENYFTRK